MKVDQDPNGNGSVRITARDIYDAVQELKTQVFGLVLASTNDHAEREDHEKRIRSLEFKFYAFLAGMIALLAGVVALTVQVVGK